MKDDKIIGFFIYSTNEIIADEFSDYLYGNNGIDTLIEHNLKNSYGSGVNLILVSYFIDGIKEKIDRQKRLSSLDKEKSIAVHIHVQISDFHMKNHIERKNFIVTSILEGINDVENKIGTKDNVNIDFDILKADFEKISAAYLNR